MPAQLMSVSPAGGFYGFGIDKCHFQGIRYSCRNQLVEQGCFRLLRILNKLYLTALIGQRDLRPHLLERLYDLILRLPLHFIIAIDLHIDQKGIRNVNIQILAVLPDKRPLEIITGRMQIHPVVIGPHFIFFLPH